MRLVVVDFDKSISEFYERLNGCYSNVVRIDEGKRELLELHLFGSGARDNLFNTVVVVSGHCILDVREELVALQTNGFKIDKVNLENSKSVFVCYHKIFDTAEGELPWKSDISQSEFVLELLERFYFFNYKVYAIVNGFFTKIGLYPNLKGHDYLLYAVEEVFKNPNYLHSVTKNLYPTVAKRFETTACGVERNIRNAIEVVFNRGKLQSVANGYYGGNFDKYEKPTNSEFIGFLMSLVKSA